MTDLSKGIIVVTGGAGFIGSALIWELNRRGLKNILAVDVLGHDEKWKNLVPLQYSDYVEASTFLQEIESGVPKYKDVSAIFHLGACSSTTEKDASFLIRNNFEYTKALLHFALSGQKRFVYASSAATYGSLEEAVPESVPLQSLRPLNMYGYSKHMFDCYAERIGCLQQITGLKYFNVYGPNEWHKGDMRSVVNKAFAQIEQTGRMTLFKSHRPDFRDGEQKRDFLYVKDAIEATIFLAENIDGGGLFNIGSGVANTWVSLAESIFKALKLAPRIDFIDMPEMLRAKYQYFTCADISKIRAAGFTQAIRSLETAVSDYVINYLKPARHLGDEPV